MRMQSRHAHVEDMILHLTVTIELLLSVYAMLTAEHGRDMELRVGLHTLHKLAEKCLKVMAPFEAKYASRDKDEAVARRAYTVHCQSAIISALFPAERLDGRVSWPYAVVRDITNLYTLLAGLRAALVGLQPTAGALLDTELGEAVGEVLHEVHRQQAWTETRIKTSCPQVLIVPLQVTERKSDSVPQP